MNNSFPIIKPIKTKEVDSKQSQYEHCAKLPMRAIILGPSGSGKTVLLQNMVGIVLVEYIFLAHQ